MSDDLIKRSDAIEALKAVECFGVIECKTVGLIKDINAIPSADRPSAVDLSSVYSTAYKSGYEKGKADRPQGEWELVGERIQYRRCPYCKRPRAFQDTRFCDWCGARMKGADDED